MIETKLNSIYKQIMWLARQPGVTPSKARAWYTHVVSSPRDVCRFTGKVSKKALKEGATLRLEHFNRLQQSLTSLVKRHLKEGDDFKEFLKEIRRCEKVHIVTFEENNEAMKAKGDYMKAGIELMDWKDIPQKKRSYLWENKLRGKVSNSNEFPH